MKLHDVASHMETYGIVTTANSGLAYVHYNLPLATTQGRQLGW